MSTAKNFEKLIKSGLNAHAAWLPLANNFELGDYGVISNGVFTKIGHIREFDVSFESKASPAAMLDLKSEGTTVTRVVADATVEQLPLAQAKAKLRFTFENKGSFVVKAARVVYEEMTSARKTAEALPSRVDVGYRKWSNKWCVIRRLYRVRDALLLASTTENTSVDLSGSAEVLAQIEAGNVSSTVEVGIESKNTLGLQLVGKSGVVALGWFKLGFFGPGYENTESTYGDEDEPVDDL